LASEILSQQIRWRLAESEFTIESWILGLSNKKKNDWPVQVR
jgi:hypothetical protein